MSSPFGNIETGLSIPTAKSQGMTANIQMPSLNIPQINVNMGSWSGRILRMQEDASALVSPDLYDKFLKEEERRQAAAFPYNLIHLHTSSLFLVDRICTIEPLKCLQINKDAGKITVPQMIPYLKRVQERGKRLLVRGKLTHDDLALLRKNLSPAGLFLQIVVESATETKQVKDLFEPWL